VATHLPSIDATRAQALASEREEKGKTPDLQLQFWMGVGQ